ncbi:class I SAM-dependent methyltransferase [Candidatus Methylospira mobilis]|uniref:Class I SAM-dependent methyltransferase n=2 Tax=Candidatus Methylospira mobilis TaxID=1808979 RepID=A0A5Q0BRQ6_9GAMM|nr:class I SAM-dependent methyltransferase [Candidatus Methylospira mobilis]
MGRLPSGDVSLAELSDYYSDALNRHGATPRGVDWNGEDSQKLRFAQLCRLFDLPGAFSVNDLGCGYGALLDYLTPQYPDIRYRGYDIAAGMIESARASHAAAIGASFVLASEPDRIADYSVTSGIFNIRLACPDDAWRDYILRTLAALDRCSTRGFAFNCLTIYSDREKMRPDLYYADPCFLFDYCKRHYSRNVALLHDYGLYDFTLLVRKAL